MNGILVCLSIDISVHIGIKKKQKNDICKK